METERLIIDSLKIQDKKDYFDNISHDKKVLETFICTYCDDIKDFDFSNYLNRNDLFAIRLKNSSKLIGVISVFNNNDKTVEIGYGIGSEYWNKGYATEAVKAFINYLFVEQELDAVIASYFINNIASRKVMDKVGMIYSHTVNNELEYLGIQRDLVYCKIDKDSYFNSQKC